MPWPYSLHEVNRRPPFHRIALILGSFVGFAWKSLFARLNQSGEVLGKSKQLRGRFYLVNLEAWLYN